MLSEPPSPILKHAQPIAGPAAALLRWTVLCALVVYSRPARADLFTPPEGGAPAKAAELFSTASLSPAEEKLDSGELPVELPPAEFLPPTPPAYRADAVKPAPAAPVRVAGLFGPPRGTAARCAPTPWGPKAWGPGFQRSLSRHSPLAPVAPAVISAHAPPWESMPAPGGPEDGLLRVTPHDHDCRACESPFTSADFSPDPFYDCQGWDACGEMGIYGNKWTNPTARPLCEKPLPFYPNGPWPPSFTFLGPTNLVQPKFFVYGDYRNAIAQNRQRGNTETRWNNRLNLDIDFWLTATERFHMFWGPLDEGQQFTGILFDGGDAQYQDHWDGFDERTDTMYFEGDLGYIVGGLQGRDAPFDLPFAVGLIPLLFQNGVWLEDAFVGAACTIPAKNSPVLDWSNFDVTFFLGFEELTTPAFGAAADEADFIGMTTFIERRGGYIEAGWAYVDDVTNQDRSYHNIGLSYTRRYLNLVSNSIRLIINEGQEGPRDQRTADGYLVLMENSFLTQNPYHVIPYANLFAGFGNPQSLGRLQGPLKNTGINFESDLLTGFPILDDTANNTYGGAFGVDLLGSDYLSQLILEFAALQTFDSDATRNAPGDQYALGVRYQRPLTNALILRADGMIGFLEGADDVSGMRMELRRKF